MTPTSVSIVLPCFNAARTVGRAIDSVLDQTHDDWTLICVDDASKDGTVPVLEDYRDRLGSRLKLLPQTSNGGPARARNIGLEAAEGAWIAILDADDAWRPDRLATLLGVASRGATDGVCDNLLGFDDHRQIETEPLFDRLPEVLDIAATVAAEHGGRYNLGYLKPLLRRDFLEQHAIRYDETLRTGEDLLLLLSCLAHGGRVSCTQDAGYVYTTPVGHGSRRLSRSTTTSPRDADLAAALERFEQRFIRSLNAADRAAIDERLAYLAAIAPLSNFRHARLQRDWKQALSLFLTSPQVRRQVWRTLAGRRGPSPGLRA